MVAGDARFTGENNYESNSGGQPEGRGIFIKK
jgi:hypothetical protein